jgi:hypothetical protein
MAKCLLITIFCLLITSYYCFGQGNESIFGQRVTIKTSPVISLYSMNNPYHNKLNSYFSTYWNSQNQFDSNNSGISESKTFHTPFWKQTGIYTLEFAGGEVGTLFNFFLNNEVWVRVTSFPPPFEGSIMNKIEWYGVYAISNTFVTSCSVLLVSKLLKQKGAWKKVAIGASIGSLINGIAIFGAPPLALSSFSLPPLGAVIGFNL